ncbi:MAG: TetR/AcrR family transcriptional regulator [Acidimicrobiales bacterium]
MASRRKPAAAASSVAVPRESGNRELSARAQATRARVIRAALECIKEQGHLYASSNEIARRAEVSWGVIQYHFGTRDGILMAVVEDGFSRLRGKLQAVEVDSPDIEDRLRAVVDAIWEYHSQPEYLLYTDILRSLRRDETWLDLLEPSLRRIDDELAEIWSRILEPVMPRAVSSRSVQHLIFATTRGLAVTRSLREDERLFTEEREMLVRALAALLREQ